MVWWMLPVLTVLTLLCGALAIRGGRARRLAAIAALLMPSAGSLWHAPALAQTAPASPADLDVSALWQAQSERMAHELGTLQPRAAAMPNVYAIAVAAQGSQALFSREAQLALQVTAARFGGAYRGGLLLSNGAGDIAGHPLATRDTIAAAARGLRERIDPDRDLALIYLASHGAPEAFLATNLPNRLALVPISARSLAEALTAAGIKRRVIIISACFSASWIPALASDDTIVITAAARDRTSFGCDDTRRLTFFGEAFLEGPLARGASLHDAFEAARTRVSLWEKQAHFTPSLPQASVGRNMQALWLEGTRPARRPAAARP